MIAHIYMSEDLRTSTGITERTVESMLRRYRRVLRKSMVYSARKETHAYILALRLLISTRARTRL